MIVVVGHDIKNNDEQKALLLLFSLSHPDVFFSRQGIYVYTHGQCVCVCVCGSGRATDNMHATTMYTIIEKRLVLPKQHWMVGIDSLT